MTQHEAATESIEDTVSSCVEKLLTSHGRYDEDSEATIANLPYMPQRNGTVRIAEALSGQDRATRQDTLTIFKAADPATACYTWEVLIGEDKDFRLFSCIEGKILIYNRWSENVETPSLQELQFLEDQLDEAVRSLE